MEKLVVPGGVSRAPGVSSEGSAPSFSSRELAQRLESISVEASTVRSLLLESIRGQHASPSDGGGFECSGEAERRFEELRLRLSLAVGAADEGKACSSGVSPFLEAAAAHGVEMERQARACEAIVDALAKIVRVGELMEKMEVEISGCHFARSAGFMAEAEAALRKLVAAAGQESGPYVDSAVAGDITVIRALRQMTRKRRTLLEGALRDCATAALDMDEPGQMRVTKSLRGHFCGRNFKTPVPLSEVFVALQSMDLLDDFFETFANDIRRKFCDLILAGSIVSPPSVDRDDSKSHLSFAVGKIAAAATSDLASSSSAAALSKPTQIAMQLSLLTSLMKFIFEEVLGESNSLAKALGDSLIKPDGEGSDLFAACLAVLQSAIPATASGLPAFRELASPCRDFERRLSEMGFLTLHGGGGAAETKQGPLEFFVSRCDEQFALSRRTAILSAGRAIMLGDYHNSVPARTREELQRSAGSWGPTQSALQEVAEVRSSSSKKGDTVSTRIFVFEPCQVTSVAQGIIDMAHAALQEGCGGDGSAEDIGSTPPIVAKELFRTARDLFELFRAIVPIHHGDQIERLPRTAALFYNDCAYLSFHLMTMGHQYRQRLPPPVNQVASMVDMVPLLRELGESKLRSQVSVQKQQLREFCSSADLLSSEDTAEVGAEAALRQCVYHLRQIAQAWRHVLPTEEYDKCMGELLEVAASMQLAATLSAKEIGEEQSHRLHQAFSALQEAEAVFSSGACTAVNVCPSWQKFKACGDVLEYSIDQISEHLVAGSFRAFSSLELADLVTALFQNSAQRNELLAAIHASER